METLEVPYAAFLKFITFCPHIVYFYCSSVHIPGLKRILSLSLNIYNCLCIATKINETSLRTSLSRNILMPLVGSQSVLRNIDHCPRPFHSLNNSAFELIIYFNFVKRKQIISKCTVSY